MGCGDNTLNDLEAQIAIPYKDFRRMLDAICTIPHLHGLLSDIATDLDTIMNYVEILERKLNAPIS